MKYFYPIIFCSALVAVLCSSFFIWQASIPRTLTQSKIYKQPEVIEQSEEGVDSETPQSNVVNQSNSTPQPEIEEEAEVTNSDNADAHACDEDTITFCKGTAVGKLKLVDCLLNDHGDEISDECRSSLERRQQLNEDLVNACQTDKQQFCSGVKPQPGDEPLVDCLREHSTELSAECLAAFEAHEAAKPTQ